MENTSIKKSFSALDQHNRFLYVNSYPIYELVDLIEAVIFDIDGTLVDHQLAIEKGIEEFYEEYFRDSEVALEEFKEIWEEEHDKNVKKYLDGEITFEEQRVLRVKGVFERAGKNIDEKTAREYFDFYLDAYERGWELFPDVLDCLDNLDGYRLAILSNGDSSQQRQKLRDTGIEDYFEEVVISGDIGIAKPEKPVFDEIVDKMEVDHDECVYIGDSYDADFVGADNAGMFACLIDRDLEVEVEFVGDNFKICSLKYLKSILDKYIE